MLQEREQLGDFKKWERFWGFCTENLKGVDLMTCGAFLYFTLCSSTSSFLSTSLPP